MATISGARNTGASHPYTCNACQVAFRNDQLQKAHMKSDWHRYNLKRKVASLPPIASEIFTDRVLQAREKSTAEAGKVAFQKKCEPCQKTYFSDNAFNNHLSSSKHKAKALAILRNGGRPAAASDDDASSVLSSTFTLGDPIERRASVDSDAEAEFSEVVERMKKAELEDKNGSAQEHPSPVERPSKPHPTLAATQNREVTENMCLFCPYESPSLQLNVTHMQRIHSMFIPEPEFLADLAGLLGYLQNLVFVKCQCIMCGKVKADPFAVQTHMRDTSHCKIPYFTEREMLRIGEFYDFRGTYSDSDEDQDSDGAMQGGTKPRLGLKKTTVVMGDDGEELEDGWETDSNGSSADTDTPQTDQALDQDESPPKQAHGAAFYDEYELHLPSGKSVGHRSLARYYKQNLRDRPLQQEKEEILALEAARAEGEAENGMDLDGGNGQNIPRSRALVSRADGGLGMIGVADHKKKEAKKVELRTRAGEDRAARRMRHLVNERQNNQKTYYYREG